MSSLTATASIALRGSQPPACSWARHNSGITAEACRPGGYLAICWSRKASFSGENAKLLGWISSGASLRTAMYLYLAQPSWPDVSTRPCYDLS